MEDEREERKRPPRDGARNKRGKWKPREGGGNREGGSRRDEGPRRNGGQRRDWKPRDGEKRRDWKPRDGGHRPDGAPRRDGRPRRDDKQRRDWKPREGEQRRDGGPRRDGGQRRDGAPRRDGDWKRGGTRGGGRSDRGGAGREYTEAERLEHSLRPVRDAHVDPEIPDSITDRDLHPSARNELKTLDERLAELIAKHLAAVAHFIDDDPERAHQHAISAMRRAGRIPVARETYAITSYVTGDYATALRELRTYRRLSGREDQLALMIDCERALGRPEKAIETGHAVDVSKLPNDVQVQVAIAMSGARLDLGQTLQALYELEIDQLQPTKAFSWSPELFAAYANVLEDLGRDEESSVWRKRAHAAEAALLKHHGGDMIEVFEVEEEVASESVSEETANDSSTD